MGRKGTNKGGEARKWHIDHEYHVQDLLYFLLAPVFSDLKDEEYFPSLGQKQPRADLFIPSVKLIIEVKFLRQTDKVTKVIDELGSDASLFSPRGQTTRALLPSSGTIPEGTRSTPFSRMDFAKFVEFWGRLLFLAQAGWFPDGDVENMGHRAPRPVPVGASGLSNS